MAVVEVVERWHGRTGEDNDTRKRTYKRIFLVRTDDFTDGPVTVGSASGIPRLYQYYAINATEIDIGSVCSKITPTQGEDPCVWEVVCDYTPRPDRPDEEPQDEQGNEKPTDEKKAKEPTLRPPVLRFGTAKSQTVFYRDVLTGDGVTMSTGERPDPPIMVDITILSLTITQNELTFNPRINAFADWVNNVPFVGFAPYTVKFEGVGAESRYEEGMFYWEKTYEFAIKHGGVDTARFGYNNRWTPIYFIDRGFLEIGANGELIQIRDKEGGTPVNSPMLLGNNAVAKRQPGAVPSYREYNAYIGMDLYELFGRPLVLFPNVEAE